MIDDADDDLRRQIRRQSDADVAEFIASLGQDDTTGVPPPPTIKISEVASQPIKLEFVGFGRQRAGTAPGAGSSPAPPATCPTGITVRFDDIVIDCGCQALVSPNTGSLLVTDLGLDGRSVPLAPYNETICAPFFGWTDYCSYLFTTWAEPPVINGKFYDPSTVCGGSPAGDVDTWPHTRVLFLDGVWYVFAYVQSPIDYVVFSGSIAGTKEVAPDPIPNDAFCSTGADWRSNPIVLCHGPGFAPDFLVPTAAHDGTATISFV